jgi:flagellar hook protein FlgE
MSSSPIGSIGLSGLKAAAKVLNNSAHNVANINTPGFEPGRTLLEDAQPGVKARVETGGVAADNSAAFSSVDLAQETVTQIGASAMYSANLASIKTEDELIGTLLDTKH